MSQQNPDKWRILYIDDDEDDYLLLRDMLAQPEGRNIRLDWVCTSSQGREKLADEHYDAVLVDYDLGLDNGIDIIREFSSIYPAPFILYTGRGSRAVDLEAMRAGTTLYLTKSEVNPLLLERSIRYAIERKKIEQELEDSLKQKTTILESIQDGLFGLDRNWRFTYINSRAAHNVGYEPEDLFGQNIWELFKYVLGTTIEENFRKTMEDRTPIHFEYQGKVTEGWYYISVYPSSEGISIYWQDITDRKQMEAALVDSERKYREQIQFAPTAIYEVNFRNRRFTSVNDAMVVLTGYSRQELLEIDPFELLDEKSRGFFRERIRQWLAGEKPDESVEYRVKAKDGHTIYVVLDVTFTRDEKGIPQGATVVGHDITARKQAEELVLQSRAKLEAALNSMTDAVFITDAQGNFVEFNDAFAKFYRFKNKTESVKTLGELPQYIEAYLPDGSIAPIEMWAAPRALRGETVTNTVYSLRRKDTGERWMGSYNFAPIRNPEGEIVGSVVVIREISG